MAVCTWGQMLDVQTSPNVPALPGVPMNSPGVADFTHGPRTADGSAPLGGGDSFGSSFVARQPAGIVSTERLARPVSRKADKLLVKAQGYVDSGEHAKAIATLQLALKEPSAVPYAHSMLGTEYLKLQRVADAITELEQAVQLLPHNAPCRSNLGYALYLAGEQERGEQEVRRALILDSGNAKTRYVLDLIERGRGQ